MYQSRPQDSFIHKTSTLSIMARMANLMHLNISKNKSFIWLKNLACLLYIVLLVFLWKQRKRHDYFFYCIPYKVFKYNYKSEGHVKSSCYKKKVVKLHNNNSCGFEV